MSPLNLQVQLVPTGARIRVRGQLNASTAHLLPKVVIGMLRRHATPSLELDLQLVESLDTIGVAALLDCQRYATRHGVLLTLSGTNARLRATLARHAAAELLPARPPPRQPHTGTICRPT